MRADGRPPASPYLPLPPYTFEGNATWLEAPDLGAAAPVSTSQWRAVGGLVRDAAGEGKVLYIAWPAGELLFIFEAVTLRVFLADPK